MMVGKITIGRTRKVFMDNLKRKKIIQYMRQYDEGIVILTAFIDNKNHIVDFWSHLEGFGVAKQVFACTYRNKKEIKDLKEICFSFIDIEDLT